MQLIPCKACGKQIAVLAASCPTCGAPNDWLHPRIKALYEKKESLTTARPFLFWSDKATVWGETKASSPWWAWLLAASVIGGNALWSAFAGLSWESLAWGAACAGLLALTSRKETFRADMASETWASTNDAFWAPVRSSLYGELPVQREAGRTAGDAFAAVRLVVVLVLVVAIPVGGVLYFKKSVIGQPSAVSASQ